MFRKRRGNITGYKTYIYYAFLLLYLWKYRKKKCKEDPKTEASV